MTRFFYLFLISFSLISCSFKVFATHLIVADNLIIVEVNEKVVKHGFIGNKSSFRFSQGKHAIVVKYKDVFEDVDLGQERVIESQAFVVKFTVTNQQQLRLNTRNIQNLKQAEKFSKSPQLSLVDENNKVQVVSLAKVSDYKLAKQVNQAVTSLVESKKNPQHMIADLPEVHRHQAKQNHQVSTSDPFAVNSLAMLQYWWNKSSLEQKRQFKAQINNSTQ
ncbi:MAG: DUF2057 family protein [Litorilituus sp.]|nr:DUF2057 family protein [Litorilituus sp.]